MAHDEWEKEKHGDPSAPWYSWSIYDGAYLASVEENYETSHKSFDWTVNDGAGSGTWNERARGNAPTLRQAKRDALNALDEIIEEDEE